MGEIFAKYIALIIEAIWMTVQLSVFGTIGALIIGTFVAILRISPVRVLRIIGTAYVNLVRNTPLTLLMVFSILGLSVLLGLTFSDQLKTNAYIWAIVILSIYHAAFICEALRSGINTIPLGQAEAARSIGLTFTQSLSQIILPQAIRGSIAPVGSTIIALIKNTTVASVIGVAESASVMKVITENDGAELPLFGIFVLVFVTLTLPIGVGLTYLSQQLAVKR